MIENNYKQASVLIEVAQKISGLPVRITWDDTLNVGAVLHLSETQWSKQLRISVNPKRPDIPYLVGVQCALAIRFYEQQESKYLSSSKTSETKTMNELLALGYDAKSAQSVMGNMGRQLRSQQFSLWKTFLNHNVMN
jgi:hypothetical protein